MNITVIDGHSYKTWVIYQSDRFQISRLEIHRWGKCAAKAPELLRGYQVIDLLQALWTHWNHGEADQLAHVLSYLATRELEAPIYDLYIERSLERGGFIGTDVLSLIDPTNYGECSEYKFQH